MRCVALRKESVDRNLTFSFRFLSSVVALRKESVDRNCLGAKADSVSQVALRKESVDRNFVNIGHRQPGILSLSARRAWIEITQQTYHRYENQSLSARRAWIEMPTRC